MKNKTIKNYSEITQLDALKMLVENDGKPVEGLAFGNSQDLLSTGRGKLRWVQLASCYPFVADLMWPHCAKVTELDPCKAPEGCPELESWMAYVGFGPMNEAFTNATNEEALDLYWTKHGKWLNGAAGDDSSRHYAIDVRTEWAQEHFPDHCRIRNYQEPKRIAKGHNPWNLTEEQVGVSDGWRLTTEDEVGLKIDKSLLQYWDSDWGWVKPSCITPGMFKGCTYRTKKPEGYFLPKPKPITDTERLEWIMDGINYASKMGWSVNNTDGDLTRDSIDVAINSVKS